MTGYERWVEQARKFSDLELEYYQRQVDRYYAKNLADYERLVAVETRALAEMRSSRLIKETPFDSSFALKMKRQRLVETLDGWTPQIVTVDDHCATETDCDEVSWDDLEAILNGRWSFT